MELINPVYYMRSDTCPSCKTERSLDLYDDKGRPIRYNIMLDRKANINLKELRLRYFKCNRCKAVFNIDWTFLDQPIPLTDSRNEKFLDNYSKLKV